MRLVLLMVIILKCLISIRKTQTEGIQNVEINSSSEILMTTTPNVSSYPFASAGILSTSSPTPDHQASYFILECDLNQNSTCPLVFNNSNFLNLSKLVYLNNSILGSFKSIYLPTKNEKKCLTQFNFENEIYNQCVNINNSLQCRTTSDDIDQCSESNFILASFSSSLGASVLIKLKIPNLNLINISFNSLIYSDFGEIDGQFIKASIKLSVFFDSDFIEVGNVTSPEYIKNTTLWDQVEFSTSLSMNQGELIIKVDFERNDSNENMVYLAFDNLKIMAFSCINTNNKLLLILSVVVPSFFIAGFISVM
ncbi:hypothetical protein BpHYR1_005918, partial [Brachionus plicatilis]